MTGSRRTDAGDVADHVRTELVRFVRALRRGGASVPANAGTTAGRALAEIGLDDRSRVRTALRASLLTDSDDFAAFDRQFDTFWRRLTAGLDEERPTAQLDDALAEPLSSLDDPTATESDGETPDGREGDDRGTGRSIVESFASAISESSTGDAGESGATAAYSPSGSATTVGSRRSRDAIGLGASCRELTRALANRQGRRFRRGTDRADVRRALRTSANTGGVVLTVPKRDRRRTAVRALLLVDVSKSVLDTVDRDFLIEFLRQTHRRWRDARAFFFDEGLREVTDAVDAPSAAAALEALEAAETAWGGGTRIGRSLEQLRTTAPAAVDRHTVVFVVSDGLERGDIDVLERELAWIDRRADRVLWLNPLATAAAYEPTARGMAAAMPYLDGLFAFAGPDDVAELARQLRRRGAGGRIGYEYDVRTNGSKSPETSNS
ncbi:VWA domain-containing protein [Halopiger thermotolerans]